MIPDPLLEEIVDAAEEGKAVPAIKLVTCAGDWVAGIPCSSREFREISYGHTVYEMKNRLDLRSVMGSGPEEGAVDWKPPEGRAAAMFGNFGAIDDEVPILSLESVSLSFGGRADGLRLPCARVPLSSIATWWIAGERHVEPPASGGGGAWFGGGIFPIGE